jgi:asparagine synthase (glutamine-hydrolysing)
VQGGRSAFEGVRELPPATLLRIGPDGAERPRRWWRLSFGPREGRRREPIAALAEELRWLLDDATGIRLRADVPVGVYLSGGLDSSATSALARRHARRPLRAFGLTFADARFDESVHQARLAAALDVDLRQVAVSDRDVAELFPTVVERAATPMLRTAPAPLLRLAQLVHDEGYKVVLTGEGADELLGGYGIFQEAMVRRFWARRPESHLRPALFRRIYPYLSRDLARSGGFVEAFFGTGLQDLDDPLYGHRTRLAASARNLRFLHPDVRAAAALDGAPDERVIARLPGDFATFGPLGQVQWVEIETFLSGYLLHAQGDRMMMAHAVEGRVPFLDVRVAEFAADLPERARLADLHEKPLLRRAMAPLLPPEIARRPKRPYRAPILRPFVGPDAPDWVAETLAPERLAASGLVDADAVGRLVAKCRRRADAGVSESDEMALVGVLSTLLLQERMVDRPHRARPARPTREVIGDRLRTEVPA